MTIFLFVIFLIFIIMKKVIRLTESDLARIVKRVIQEEQVNESKFLKKLLTGITIVAGLNLSSCKTKDDVKEKLPEVEKVVQDQLNNMNDMSSDDGNDLVLDSISEITSFTPCKECNKQYFIVSKVKQTDGKNLFMILIYEEKDNKGYIVGQMNAESKEEVKSQIDHMKKYSRWDQYSNYGDYIDQLESDRISLDLIRDEYNGKTNNGFYGDKPSDYIREIDAMIEKLGGDMVSDLKNDLKMDNVSKEEFDLILKNMNELRQELEDFKYSIK